MTEKKSRNLILPRKRKPAEKAQTGEQNGSKALVPAGEKIIGRKGNRAGFYAEVLDEAEALDFEKAAGTEGLDDEIALLRVKIKALVERQPDNVRLLMTATNMLARLVKIRYSMNKKQEKNLGEAIRNIVRDIGVPLGVALLNRK